jgi:hypothetical protein
VITPPSTIGPSQSYKTNAHGPIFNYAAGLDDFTNTSGVPIPVPPFFNHYRINQFLGGSVTTYSGAKGSFVGPWTTSMVEATSNGLPYPSGHVRVSPSALWSDGIASNGAARPWDAFGEWART